MNRVCLSTGGRGGNKGSDIRAGFSGVMYIGSVGPDRSRPSAEATDRFVTNKTCPQDISVVHPRSSDSPKIINELHLLVIPGYSTGSDIRQNILSVTGNPLPKLDYGCEFPHAQI